MLGRSAPTIELDFFGPSLSHNWVVKNLKKLIFASFGTASFDGKLHHFHKFACTSTWHTRNSSPLSDVTRNCAQTGCIVQNVKITTISGFRDGFLANTSPKIFFLLYKVRRS